MALGENRRSLSCSDNFFPTRAQQEVSMDEETTPSSRRRSLPTALPSPSDDDGDNPDLETEPGEIDQSISQPIENSLPPNHSSAKLVISSQSGSFGSLPVEIFDIILDFLLPVYQTIVIMPLLHEKKSLATVLMPIRLSSKRIQELVLDYWHSARVRRDLTDNNHLGLVNPARTTWVFMAEPVLWYGTCDRRDPRCSFREQRRCSSRITCYRRALLNILQLPLASRNLLQNVVLCFSKFDTRSDVLEFPDMDMEPNAALKALLDHLPLLKKVQIDYLSNPRPGSSWSTLQAGMRFQESLMPGHIFVPNSKAAISDGLGNWSPRRFGGGRWTATVVLNDYWRRMTVKKDFGLNLGRTLRYAWVPHGGKVRVLKGGKKWVTVRGGETVDGVVVSEGVAEVN